MREFKTMIIVGDVLFTELNIHENSCTLENIDFLKVYIINSPQRINLKSETERERLYIPLKTPQGFTLPFVNCCARF